jgi:hypothetical protein
MSNWDSLSDPLKRLVEEYVGELSRQSFRGKSISFHEYFVIFRMKDDKEKYKHRVVENLLFRHNNAEFPYVFKWWMENIPYTRQQCLKVLGRSLIQHLHTIYKSRPLDWEWLIDMGLIYSVYKSLEWPLEKYVNFLMYCLQYSMHTRWKISDHNIEMYTKLIIDCFQKKDLNKDNKNFRMKINDHVTLM